MTVKINLIPERVRHAEKLRIIVALGVLAQVIPLALVFWRFGAAKAELGRVEEEINRVNRELNSPQLINVVREVEQFTKDQSLLKTKSEVVNVLRKRQSTLVRFFDVLQDLVPRRAWVKRLESTADAKTGKLKIQADGVALAPEVVAEFYAALQTHPVIKDAEMVEAPKPVAEGAAQAVTFKLRFSVEDFE